MVRHWIPRFRGAEMDALVLYERHASALYYPAEAEVIERVCRSEIRRRHRLATPGENREEQDHG